MGSNVEVLANDVVVTLGSGVDGVDRKGPGHLVPSSSYQEFKDRKGIIGKSKRVNTIVVED